MPPSPQPVVQDTRSGTSTESPPDISSNPHPSPRVKPQPPPRPVQVHPEVQQTLHNPTPGMHNPTPGMQPIMNHQPMISPQHVMNPQPVIQPAFTPQQQVALYQVSFLNCDNSIIYLFIHAYKSHDFSVLF